MSSNFIDIILKYKIKRQLIKAGKAIMATNICVYCHTVISAVCNIHIIFALRLKLQEGSHY